MPDTSEERSFVTSETRVQHLMRTGKATPRFLQGVFPFVGHGLFEHVSLHGDLVYTVPPGRTAEVHYFRAGNHSDDLIYLTILQNGMPIRFFPVGPKADVHVSLAIVEAHAGGEVISIGVAAPRGLAGSVVVDTGIVEIEGQG